MALVGSFPSFFQSKLAWNKFLIIHRIINSTVNTVYICVSFFHGSLFTIYPFLGSVIINAASLINPEYGWQLDMQYI